MYGRTELEWLVLKINSLMSCFLFKKNLTTWQLAPLLRRAQHSSVSMGCDIENKHSGIKHKEKAERRCQAGRQRQSTGLGSRLHQSAVF